MRKTLMASGFGLLGLAAVPASAMPFGSMAVSDPGVTLVAQGCGPGFHRGYYGRCIPNGYGYHYGYVAPHVYRYGYAYHPYHRYYGYHPYYRHYY
jgi:hypothetical protein